MKTYFLIMHVIAGVTALISGLLVMLARKGGRFHVKAGRWFYFSMLVVALSAFLLTFIDPNLFLGIIGVFTFYMTVSGQRMIRVAKKRSEFMVWDKVLSIFMLLFAGTLLYLGMRLLWLGNSFGLVNVVFAVVSIMYVRADYGLFRASQVNSAALTAAHLQRMMGSYIAALTAFLVVNLPDGLIPPGFRFIPWLLPTALLVPFIVSWSAKFGNARNRPAKVAGP